jgi:hypothetical protein
MKALGMTDKLEDALLASGCDLATIAYRPRLLQIRFGANLRRCCNAR